MSWTAPRTWSAGAVLTAAQLNTDVRDNLNVLSTALLIPAHQTGKLYVSQCSVQGSDGAVTANILYAVPIIIPNTGTYNLIGLHVATGSAGNMRMGLYADNSGLPGALLQDGGVVATDTSGDKTVTISQSLTGPGLYWMAAVFSATPTISTYASNSLFSEASSDPKGAAGVSRSFTYAALPNPFGGTPGWIFSLPGLVLGRS